jgi:hypothetical protein
VERRHSIDVRTVNVDFVVSEERNRVVHVSRRYGMLQEVVTHRSDFTNHLLLTQIEC